MDHMSKGHSWTTFRNDLRRRLQEDNDSLFAKHYMRMLYQGMAISAYGLAVWQSGMTRAALNAYPAWKFVRVPGSKIKRERHEQHENDIRLKTDWAYWADFQNSADIGGFGKPYPQFGYNSHMIQEPVSFESAARRGLIDRQRKGRLRLTKRMRFYPDFPTNYREGNKITVHGLDKETREELRRWLRAAGVPTKLRPRYKRKPRK